VRERVTYVSQEQQLHGGMSVAQLGTYLAHFYSQWDDAYLRRLAERFEVPPDQPVHGLSGGQRRKVAVLLALAPHPEVVLMDEPAAGLDPIARRQLIEELVDCLADRSDMTIVLSTHIITDLERLAEHVGIMDRGRMVTSGRLDDLQSGTRRVQVIFDGAAPPNGFRVPGAVRTRVEGPVVTAVARLGGEGVLDELRAQPGVRVQTFPLNLEELFIEMLGREAREEMREAV
jgi:ABC-2 type transport system ATP-binding protein